MSGADAATAEGCSRGGRTSDLPRCGDGMTILPPALLGAAGPAQFELLIHFCGRPNLAASTPNVPQTIRDQPPWLRL